MEELMGRTIAHAKCQRMPRQVGEACLGKSRQVGGDGDYPFAKSRSARYWQLRKQVWAYLSKSGLGKSTKKKNRVTKRVFKPELFDTRIVLRT